MPKLNALGKKRIFIDSKLITDTVKSHIIVSKDLEKYFRCYEFYSSYDEEIYANNSVINIPALSIVLPIAWITGADVYVDELDETFASSMDALQSEYKKIYPKAPFKTKLIVKNLIKNKNNPNSKALLYSGGIDSTYSLFRNINPRLIMIFGVMDIPISNLEFQEKIKSEYINFAEREGLKLNFIHTNALEVMDHSRLRHLWGRYQERHEGDFWNGIGYSLGQIGQVAPFSTGRFNQLLFAASYDEAHSVQECPDASSPQTDEKITWVNLNVKHDGNIHRYKKVLSMKNFIRNTKIKLRVCWSSPEYLFPYNIMNCNKCEKCLRTIASLTYAGINPNECGFHVDDSTFELMRFIFEEKLLTQKHIKIWWKPLQKMIPDEIEGDVFGSKQFFEWFKTLDLDSKGRQYRNPLYSLYFQFPFFVSDNLRRLYISIWPNKYQIFQPIEFTYERTRERPVSS